MSTERDYVLGTHDAEIERLGLQHRVWRPHTAALWRRAGFTAGQTLLDLGCGPGYATIDLAEIAGPAGKIIALDRSHRFLDALRAALRSRGLSNVETQEVDLDEGPLPPVPCDGVWSRWIYAFLRDPRRLLERAAAVLRPGGVMAMYEYADYGGWRMAPRSEVFESFVGEVMSTWRASGGEPDVGLELPAWLEALGFEVREARPVVETPRPEDFFWQWPKAFVDVGLERLEELGSMDEARAQAVRDALAHAEATPGAYMITPTVLGIIAIKRRVK